MPRETVVVVYIISGKLRMLRVKYSKWGQSHMLWSISPCPETLLFDKLGVYVRDQQLMGGD